MTNRANSLPDQATGQALAGYSYLSHDDDSVEKLRKLPVGWKEIGDVVEPDYFSEGYNVQKSSDGKVLENQFIVLINPDEKRIAFSIKGSTAFANFVSDIANGGHSEYLKIVDQMQ